MLIAVETLSPPLSLRERGREIKRG